VLLDKGAVAPLPACRLHIPEASSELFSPVAGATPGITAELFLPDRALDDIHLSTVLEACLHARGSTDVDASLVIETELRALEVVGVDVSMVMNLRLPAWGMADEQGVSPEMHLVARRLTN